MGSTAFSGYIDGVGPFDIKALSLGSLTVPAGTPMGGQVLPVQAFLINHQQGVLLFDTGLGAAYPAFDRLLAPTVRCPLEDALDASDVHPTDVKAVINCHLHYDHAGGNPLFPGIPIFVQAREHEAAGELAYLIRERVDFPGVDLRLLQGETQVLPGVRTIPTPGHTPGHQSLVIDDRGGPVVLAGQAAYTVAEFVDPERDPARGFKTAYDQQEFVKSLSRVRALKPQRIYFSHNERVWEPPSGY
jgi:glyoxylase-like metal-dependent hydrolase (beta-lactamase superfamily II)